MITVETILPVSAARAFALLEDPRLLRILVLGARRIRRFDPHWPAPGSKVHHSVGVFPFVVRDTTQVLECVQDSRLVLEARVRAIGVFIVAFQLHTLPGGTSRLVIGERVVKGLLRLPPLQPLAEQAIKLRNAELGRRFERLVKQRQAAATSARA